MTQPSDLCPLTPCDFPSPPDKIFFDLNDQEARITKPFMNDANGGGRLEDVPGLNTPRARIAGLPGAAFSPVPTSSHMEPEKGGFENFFHTGDPMVPIEDASVMPFSSIAFLRLQYEDGSEGFGTGWFVSSKTIVTAGHCLFHHERKTPVKNVTVTPGLTARFKPFRSYDAVKYFTPSGWKESVNNGKPDSGLDYGLLFLSEPVGHAVGWFGLAAAPDSGLNGLLLNISGYSGHQGYVSLYYDGGRLRSFDADYLYHQFDTQPGMSGSPIIVRRDNRRYVVGIHTRGEDSTNRALRINDKIFDEISSRLL